MFARSADVKLGFIAASILEVIRETADIVTLRILPPSGVPSYVAGQYITVYFPDIAIPEGKAYSLSSFPGQAWLAISVKLVDGPYSRRLHELTVGDTIYISSPYGTMCPSPEMPLVMLAGGIGISPMWSIIQADYATNSLRRIDLWYSNRTLADCAFLDDLQALANRHRMLTLHCSITRDPIQQADVGVGRIDVAAVVAAAEADAMFMVCGTITFVRAMWRQLRDWQVPESRIMTEIFFENAEQTKHGNAR